MSLRPSNQLLWQTNSLQFSYGRLQLSCSLGHIRDEGASFALPEVLNGFAQSCSRSLQCLIDDTSPAVAFHSDVDDWLVPAIASSHWRFGNRIRDLSDSTAVTEADHIPMAACVFQASVVAHCQPVVVLIFDVCKISKNYSNASEQLAYSAPK